MIHKAAQELPLPASPGSSAATLKTLYPLHTCAHTPLHTHTYHAHAFIFSHKELPLVFYINLTLGESVNFFIPLLGTPLLIYIPSKYFLMLHGLAQI